MSDDYNVGFGDLMPEEIPRLLDLNVIEVRFDTQGDISYHLTPQAIEKFNNNITLYIKEVGIFED